MTSADLLALAERVNPGIVDEPITGRVEVEPSGWEIVIMGVIILLVVFA